MAKEGIDKKPLVRLHPKVWTAMHVYANRPKEAPDHQKEKGFLLAGDVSQGGMVIDVTDIIIFPQKGNGTAVDFDNTHAKAGKFWPAVHQWCTKHNKVVVGWAHYFSGGVHHSSHDDFTDDLLSQGSKGKTPVFVSMTWNDDKAGVEGKLWAKVGETDIQITVTDLPLEFVYDDSVVAAFEKAIEPKMKVKIGVQFDDITFVVPAEDLGLDTEQLIQAAFEDLRADTAAYINTKEGDLGQKLWRLMRTHGIDQTVADQVTKQLESMWRPDGVTQDFRGKAFPQASGKASGVQTNPNELYTNFVMNADGDEMYVVLTEDEAEDWEAGGIDWSTLFSELLIVDTDGEKKAVTHALETDIWDIRTVHLKTDGLKRGHEFQRVQAGLARQGYVPSTMGTHPANQMTLRDIAMASGMKPT